jgi:predicted secreted hydrolase
VGRYKRSASCCKNRRLSAGRLALAVATGALCLAISIDASGPASRQPTKTMDVDAWRQAEPGYSFVFPRDHAAHPEYRIEWWYYTGNVQSSEGRRFGYQLTFFRAGVVPRPLSESRWAVRDLHIAHFAVSDIDREAFHSFERLNRSGIGWAGADTTDYRIWNEDWEARTTGRDHLLKTRQEDCSIDLKLSPAKPEVIHGENGISQKGAFEGNASCYYSITRLRTSGTITVNGEAFEVSGLSWMDHEFGTSFLEPGQIGWDWFSVQLEDGRDLMLFEGRRIDGSIDPHSSGTLIDRDGQVAHISYGEFLLASQNHWRSPRSGADYPTSWTIELPKFGLRLRCDAALEDQEFVAAESTGVTYWEGSIVVEGTAATEANVSPPRAVRGRGYLEMTGYAGQSMGAIMQ